MQSKMEMRALKSKSSLQPVLAVIFLHTLGLSMVVPFLVGTVFQLGSGGMAFGLILTSYAFFQLIGAPVMTDLTERIGFRKLLLWTEIGTFLGWAIFLVGGLMLPNIPLHLVSGHPILLRLPLLFIFIARSLAGLTAGNISVSSSAFTSQFSALNRNRYFMQSAILKNIALILGPVLGGMLSISAWGNNLSAFAALIISLSGVFITYYEIGLGSEWEKVDHRPLSDDPSKTIPSNNKKQFIFLNPLWQLQDMPFIAFLYFLVFVAMSFFYVGFPIYAFQNLHWDGLKIGLFFAFLTGVPMVMNHAVFPYLVARYSLTSLIIVGCAILAAGFVLLGVSESEPLYIGGLLFGIGSGMLWPTFHIFLCSAGKNQDQLSIRLLSIRVGSLARLTGLLTGTILFQYISIEIFMLAAKLSVLAALLAVRLSSLERRTGVNNNSFN